MLDIVLRSIVYLLSLPVIIKLLHLYQMKDYNNMRFLKSVSKLLLYNLLPLNLLFFHILGYNVFYFVCVCNLILNLNSFHLLPKSKKTPLKYTNKVKRILFLQIVLTLISIHNIITFIMFETIIILSPIISKEINIYDKIKNYYFVKKAQKKLKSMQANVIAITGSNGKTSVKNILQSFLNIKYKSVYSPASFNTPLGIAKFINNIDENVEFVILEFGARKIGDIKKLCHLFTPDLGIITMVGNQHLATFKKYENIYKTKAELSLYLKEKPCIFNLDNLGTNTMYKNKTGEKYGISLYENQSEIFARNINIKNGVTHFDLLSSNKIYSCKTQLLGRHNITNILLCFAMAKELDIPENLIIEKINELKQTPHRLELIKTDIYILDDTYNCSLASAQTSLEVLSQMPNKKMIVTPGIIEGGIYEEKINQDLGKMIAKFDYVVIVGNHNKNNLITGIKQVNNTKKILFALSIDEAKQYFKILNKNDTLLLLNDLPDDYN